jgi:NAD(P)-dependent dehydrogenase (short-subunit alcohol dehydrogenase family)
MSKVIVTGGASGIGAAVCRKLVSDGVQVVSLDLVDGVDVADSAAITAAIDVAVEELDGLTGLVCSAGIGMVKPFASYRDEEWYRMIGVNLNGVYFAMRAAIPHMQASGEGSIVTISSLSAERPTWGEAPYCAAKAGVVALTKSAALEFAPTIRVNCVSPGFIETPLTAIITGNNAMRNAVEDATPAGRMGEAAEVADLVSFLLSDGASYMTGQNIGLDGGSALVNPQVNALLKALKPK